MFFSTNPKEIDYFLPDFCSLRRGQIKTPANSDAFKDLSSVHLGRERFIIPETLICPSYMGIKQMGLIDGINRTCNGSMDYVCFGRYMLKNIIVFGGNAAIPGLKERMYVFFISIFSKQILHF